MDATTIATDYLVIGAGATAMAFVDTLLDESDASVVLVDRHAQPGGHWNDAYSFVRLHQPSAFYGVNSRELGSGRKDESEWGGGLYELASGAEIVSYFDQIMRQRFLPSGRVRFFPMCSYEGDRAGSHCFTSLLTGESLPVQVHRKLVASNRFSRARKKALENLPRRLQTDDPAQAAYPTAGVGSAVS